MERVRCFLFVVVSLICVAGTIRFIIGDSTTNLIVTQKTEKNDLVENATIKSKTQQEKNDTKNPIQKEECDLWDNILQEFITINGCNELKDLSKLRIHESNETITQNEWTYKINGAYITKQKSDKWNGMRDYGDFKCDENGTIINGYSYVSIPISVTCCEETDEQIGLNSIDLWIFDKEGSYKFSDGPAAAALEEESSVKEFFLRYLEKGEAIDTEIVFVVPDNDLENQNGFMLNINNSGTMSEIGLFSLIKIPLGGEYDKDVEN